LLLILTCAQPSLIAADGSLKPTTTIAI
jgi:hypothetical protein